MKKLYNLSIPQPGYIFVFKGKKLRTPLEFKHITSEEVEFLKIQARKNAIQYIVEEETRIGE